MKQLFVVVLLASLLSAPLTAAPAGTPSATAAATAAAAAPTARRAVTLDGVRVRLREGTRQVVTVNRTRGWHARVTFWSKQGRWRKRFRALDGRVGYGGLVRPHRRQQGSGTTPLGTYRLPWAFGMHAQRKTWDPSYRKVRRGDFWVLDNDSRHYNRFRNKSQGGFRWRLPSSHPDSSERLQDYRQQYEWSVVTDFNKGQVEGRGGAIFFHVNGSGATAGCISAPRWFLKRAMRRLDSDRVPVIAIGR